MEMCHREGIFQIDLLNGSKNRVNDREYWAQKKGQAATVNAEKFMGIVRKHIAFEELTPPSLREMNEKIVAHECSCDEDGTCRQDIEIYYSFVGKIDLPE